MKFKSVIGKISKGIDTCSALVCVALLSVCVVVGIMQVVARFILQSSIPWSEELLRFCFVWLTFLGVGLGLNTNTHMSVEFFTSIMPKRVRNILMVVVSVLVLIFCTSVFVNSLTVIQMAIDTGMHSSAMEIPMIIPYMGVCLPFGMMQFQMLNVIAKNVLILLDKYDEDEPGKKEEELLI